MNKLLTVAIALLVSIPAAYPQENNTERRLSGVQNQVTVLHAKVRDAEKRIEALEKKVSILIRMKVREHELADSGKRLSK